MDYDYIVIGAGAAGLSFAALMEKKGKRVALLEAHSLTGGCSSYFERDGFLFDAGATTLSGVQNNRPLKKLNDELGLNLNFIKIDPGIVFSFENKTLKRFGNLQEWINELNNNFPNIPNEKIWKKINAVNEIGWDLSTINTRKPFAFKNIKGVKAIPYLLSSTERAFHLNEIEDAEYRALINELLFITAQNKMDDTPALMGAMGLSYPDDTYYLMGGMKTFAQALEKKCSHLFLRNKVTGLKKINEGFEVQTNKQTLKAHSVVSSLPVWNHNQLFNEKVFAEPAPVTEDCWSAFMIYMTIPKVSNRQELYHQVHCDPIPHCDSHSFFVSISHPADDIRSRDRQTVTISCHVKPSAFLDLDSSEYKERKKLVADYILTIFQKRFGISDLQNIMTGTPKTFIRYTNRYHGLVGGIPHSLRRNIIKQVFPKMPFKDFYLIGDTQFPGQGIAAVVLGSQNLAAIL